MPLKLEDAEILQTINQHLFAIQKLQKTPQPKQAIRELTQKIRKAILSLELPLILCRISSKNLAGICPAATPLKTERSLYKFLDLIDQRPKESILKHAVSPCKNGVSCSHSDCRFPHIELIHLETVASYCTAGTA